VFDYLLAGLWPSEEDMAATREGRGAAPIGTPRRADEVPLSEIGLGGLASAQPVVPTPAPVRVAEPPAAALLPRRTAVAPALDSPP